MKTTNFNWGDTTIDSRDIITRHEELQEEYDALVENLEEAASEFRFLSNSDESSLAEYQDAENTFALAQNAFDEFNEYDNKEELDLLNEVIAQGEDSPDWSYGEVLINESYFTEYTKDLIDDCYDFPSEFTDGKWPWNHMNMDWEAAAEEAKADYTTIEVGGETYYIRA